MDMIWRLFGRIWGFGFPFDIGRNRGYGVYSSY